MAGLTEVFNLYNLTSLNSYLWPEAAMPTVHISSLRDLEQDAHSESECPHLSSEVIELGDF